MLKSPRSYRPVIMGRRGAVATNHPVATQAGLSILQAGGNAVDASVAVALTLGVVEPYMSGLGGDGFYHVHDRGAARGVVYNGTGAAPRAATAKRYAAGIPMDGPLSFSTPGTVGALETMYRAHGRLPWGALFAAAIDAARDGFGATHSFCYYAAEQEKRLRADPRSASLFLPGGALPRLGCPIVQPDLARTLESLRDEGAESFYRGALATALAKGCAEIGALVDADDLALFQTDVQQPIEIIYRGYKVTQSPPNSTGWTMLQELKIAEQFDLPAMEPFSADVVHILVEAKKLAFADRERYGADPRYFEAPLDRLLSDDYAAAQAKKIDLEWAASLPQPPGGQGDTTYFCIVDGDGNAVSAIQSINAIFGSGFIAGDTGILLNSRMSPWHLEPDHPNRLIPGKRVRHTMNTPMIFKDGRLWAVMGTPGGDYQVQVNLQVLTAMIDFGYDPQQAAEAPRWSSTQPGQETDYPHACPDALNLEARFGPKVMDDLAGRGHAIVPLGDLEGPCNIEIIRRDAESGMLFAGSDPRRDGWALAY